MGGFFRSHRLVLFLAAAAACALLVTKWVPGSRRGPSEPTDLPQEQVSGKVREPQNEEDLGPRAGGGRAAIIEKWATSFDPAQAGIDPELAKRLKELVEAGNFKEAVHLFMGWEDEQWQQAAAHYVWFHWARQNRDEARDFLGSVELLPNARMSASAALFEGLANRTSSEDIQWMKVFLTEDHKPVSVPGVEGSVAKLWVASGVISVGEFMEWAHASGDDHLATWVSALSLAPKAASSYELDGQLSKGDLMELASSCLEVARELRPAIEGADGRTINPKAELRQKVSSLLQYSGEAIARVLGANDLAGYPAPADGWSREMYFSGVGTGLAEEKLSAVHEMVMGASDAGAAGVIWPQYLNSQIRNVADPVRAVAISSNLDASGGFRDQLIDIYVDRLFSNKAELLFKAVEALPPGEVRDRYALGVAREWAEKKNGEEERRWLDQVGNRSLVPSSAPVERESQ